MKSAFLESAFNMKEYVFPVEDEMYRKEMEIAENNNIDQVHIKEVIEFIIRNCHFKADVITSGDYFCDSFHL